MRSLYLIAGTDGAKIDATRARLRARAEGDGGAGALEVFEPSEGGAARPRGAAGGDPGDVADRGAPLPARRRGRALARSSSSRRSPPRSADLPPDLTVVLIARAKAPAKLVEAVKAAGGEVHEFEAPQRAGHAAARWSPRPSASGSALEPAAARMLVDRMGANPVRLRNELERLALWAGEGGEVTAADLDAMVADTSEAAVWALSDALLERDPPGRCGSPSG